MCVSYFRKEWDIELHTDASPVGLGTVFCQVNPKNPNEKQDICFMSQLLSDVERKYRQCEKEALAVVWACEMAHFYLIGQRFLIAVDYRAVQLI